MRYAVARYKKEQRELTYRIYVSDTLRMITENTAKFAGGGYIKARYADLIDTKNSQIDNRSGDEIAADIIVRLAEMAKKQR